MPTSDPESSAPAPDDDHTSAEAAEKAAAEAELRAEAARARADELRRKLAEARGQSAAEDAPEVEVATEADVATEVEAEIDQAEAAPPLDAIPLPERRQPRSRITTVAVALGAAASVALLSWTGYMVWQHQKTAAVDERTAEFSAAARQGVVNLMSMDYNAAKESVQRVLEGSTGEFHENIEGSADDLIKAMQSSKVITTVTVNDSAVETMTADTATVLVSATSEKRDAAQPPNADTQPRVWRVVVMVARDGGQVKVSDIEFV